MQRCSDVEIAQERERASADLRQPFPDVVAGGIVLKAQRDGSLVRERQRDDVFLPHAGRKTTGL